MFSGHSGGLDFRGRFKLEINCQLKSHQPLDGLSLPHGLDVGITAVGVGRKGGSETEPCSSSTSRMRKRENQIGA